MLHVRLLGGFEVREGDQILPFADSARAQSFVAYLLLHSGGAQRQRLAFLLWPESTEAQARTNLRHVLHNVRRVLPDPDRFLEVSPAVVRWRPDAPFWLDVAAFEESLTKADQAPEPAGKVSALRAAVALYSKDLLDGFYDDWLLEPRERLRRRYLAALERLAELLAASGEHGDAIEFAQRLLREDPVHEAPYRMLMRLYGDAGDRARAVRVYHACVSTLEREMNVTPSPATVTAYESVLSGGSPAAPVRRERVAAPSLVGRADQFARLTSLWDIANQGHARFVLVSGEPGVGKTRLVDEFAGWCAHQGAVVASARSFAAEGTLAYGLLIDWLKSDALQPALARLTRSDSRELARLLPPLAGDVAHLRVGESAPPNELRRRLFDVAVRTILAARQPVVLVADDIPCADSETLQFLHYLLRIASNARVLVIATARREAPDDHQSLRRLTSALYAINEYHELALQRFAPSDTAMLAAHLLGRPLDATAASALHDETEGNALFIIETLRAGWDRQRTPSSAHELAPRLQAVIRLRLGQLSAVARHLAGVAATIGREFASDVLAGASDVDSEAFVAALDELWRHGIVRERGADAYDFSHDKIREVAYGDISPVRRRHHHLRVAETLMRLAGSDPTAVSSQLAAHFERAGRFDEAVSWYQRAAKESQAVHATSEALRLLERALDLLAALPETDGRAQVAVEILSAIPVLIGSMEGFSSTRLVDAQRRAIERGRAAGVEPAPALQRSLAMTSLSSGDFDRTRRIGTELATRGERDGDNGLIVEAHYLLGIAAFWSGEFPGARDHFALVAQHFDHVNRSGHVLRFGHDPQVICLSRLANTMGFLGRIDTARRMRDDTLALAAQTRHPFSYGTALVFGALLSLDLHELERCRELVVSLTALGLEHQSAPLLLCGSALAGLIQVFDGHADHGLARIEQARRESRSLDSAPGMTATLLRLLLAAHLRAGDAAGGLAVADEAIAACPIGRTWESEAHRLRAEFLRATGGPASEIEAELKQSLDVAERQAALLFVLRSADALARHRLDNDDRLGRDQSRAILETTLRHLTEAADFVEYREAVTLLQQL